MRRAAWRRGADWTIMTRINTRAPEFVLAEEVEAQQPAGHRSMRCTGNNTDRIDRTCLSCEL
jgi:hypothetical protein